MKKKIIVSDSIPKATGPYSHAVETDGWIYLSGQLPLDPATGEVAGGDAKTQTQKALENIEGILKAAGLDMTNVIKCTVYMTNLADFAEMNEVYGRFFTEKFPARVTIQAVALPKGVSVEIDAIAKR